MTFMICKPTLQRENKCCQFINISCIMMELTTTWGTRSPRWAVRSVPLSMSRWVISTYPFATWDVIGSTRHCSGLAQMRTPKKTRDLEMRDGNTGGSSLETMLYLESTYQWDSSSDGDIVTVKPEGGIFASRICCTLRVRWDLSTEIAICKRNTYSAFLKGIQNGVNLTIMVRRRW